ncbi:MAG: hypothetical protein GEV28_27175 [Actinophytocola sp.]|nr:hypothetical protein [Actinophytocola sp.]
MLATAGLDVVFDLWSASARQDWYSWAIREAPGADYVLVVVSEQYGASGDGLGPSAANRGVQSEAALLRELLYSDRKKWLPRILPVLLPGHDIADIPLFLQLNTVSHYELTSLTAEGVAELLEVIRRRPGDPAPEARPAFPPRARPQGRVVNQINGTVNGKVVQAETIEGDVNFF